MIDPKYFLMPLSTSGHVEERLLGALAIGAFFQAHVDVMHADVSPTHFVPKDMVGVKAELLSKIEALAAGYSSKHLEQLRQLFETACGQKSVSLSPVSIAGQATANWREINGLRSELVAEHGKVADAIICPQSKSRKVTSTFHAAIMHSGKPVFLVPRTMTEFQPETALIAWNASTEVARSVSFAIPLLAKMKRVIIATSAASLAKPGVDELQGYLKRHGVESEFVPLLVKGKAVGKAILDTATQNSADVLVMGAYTHKSVHEQIFGGVTHHMVEAAEIPIFMMH